MYNENDYFGDGNVETMRERYEPICTETSCIEYGHIACYGCGEYFCEGHVIEVENGTVCPACLATETVLMALTDQPTEQGIRSLRILAAVGGQVSALTVIC